MTANTPPKPHTEGMEWTNTETGIKYMFTNGGWRAISSEASEEVAEAIDNIDLQKVCNNGYVTDTPLAVETEKGVSIITSQELRITHQDNPYIRLVDMADGDAIEITLNDDHGHIDLSDINDELHFKFGSQEKVVFKGTGDAEFLGKVKVQPGAEDNEVVTYGQLVTLEEEIEQLAPSLDRGSWTFTLEYPPGPGEYTMIKEFLDEDAQEALCNQLYNECLTASGGDNAAMLQCNRNLNDCMNDIIGSRTVTTNKWEECEELVFNNVDAKGVTHSWAGIDSDHYIDVFNEANEGHRHLQQRAGGIAQGHQFRLLL